MIKKGTIVGFHGSWMSGIATMDIKDSKTGEIQSVPCENGQTVRSLDSAFGGVIGQGHCVNLDAVKDKEIYWAMDDMGLMLAGFVPVDDAPDRVQEVYEAQEGE